MVAALTPDEGAEDLGAFSGRAPERIVALLGAEGDGLSRQALAASDVRVRIPMCSGVDSVNVATACAIALHRLGERA
jgi:tRNA G18 (ribose-2'-O)-methylase SpoU